MCDKGGVREVDGLKAAVLVVARTIVSSYGILHNFYLHICTQPLLIFGFMVWSFSPTDLSPTHTNNASLQSLLLAGNFFVQPIAAECWRGRGGKLWGILGKYLMNTLYVHIKGQKSFHALFAFADNVDEHAQLAVF